MTLKECSIVDIIEFCEKVLDYPLLDYQKDFIKAVYEATKDGKQIVYMPHRGGDRFTLQLLQALVISITPAAYGDYILQHRKRGKKK